MDMIRATGAPTRAIVDRGGRLVAADQLLDELNARAGGGIGMPVAIPPLAALVRLAQRLGIVVSRALIVADRDADLDLWVRIEPASRPEQERDDASGPGDVDVPAGGASLTVTGWRVRGVTAPGIGRGAAGDEREAAFLASEADWLWETDAALRLTFVSSSAGARHGFDAAACLGQPLTRLFILGDDGGAFPMLGALAVHQRFENQPATIRASGHRVRLAATPRIDAAGIFAGFVGAAHMLADGTEAGSTVATGTLLAAPGASAGRAPGGLVAAGNAAAGDASADPFAGRLDQALRSPLGRIIANADSINARSDGPLPQDYVDYAADIASAGRHLLGLVDDLVDLQAIERPDFSVRAEAVDLADVARRAAGLLAVRAAANSVRIDKPAPADVLPVTGEFRRILQVLVNLIGNAVRYSPNGAMIWIRAEREGDVAAVIVADQGKGIALPDQVRIFDKFERVDPHEPGGSGLGLYIARRLARAMGGDVTVDSAPGQGARFVFTLPSRET